MFTFIICKCLKLKDDGAKMVMAFVTMFVDFFFIMMILEGLGLIK